MGFWQYRASIDVMLKGLNTPIVVNDITYEGEMPGYQKFVRY